jgi:hypothetical protein
VIFCTPLPTPPTIVLVPSVLQHDIAIYVQTVHHHDPLLLVEPHHKLSHIISQNPIEKIKTKHIDAQSSFLITFSIWIAIKVDRVLEKMHISKTLAFTWRQTQTHKTLTNCTWIIIIINKQQN